MSSKHLIIFHNFKALSYRFILFDQLKELPNVSTQKTVLDKMLLLRLESIIILKADSAETVLMLFEVMRGGKSIGEAKCVPTQFLCSDAVDGQEQRRGLIGG